MTEIPYSAWHLLLPAFWYPDLPPKLHPGQPPVPIPGFPPNPCLPAALLLIEAVNVRQIAATLAEGELRSQLEKSADVTIARVIEDWCPTPPPGPGPWPWLPMGAGIASLLAAAANSIAADSVRQELLRIAGQALERSFIGTAAE